MNQISLEHILRCPECEGSLNWNHTELQCSRCLAQYYTYRSSPVLLRRENPLFTPDMYIDEGTSSSLCPPEHPSWKARIKKLVPSRSINLCRDRVLKIIAGSISSEACILVVGCGTQRKSLESYFNTQSARFVFTDIDQLADCDVFADAHNLPFKDQVFDGVITTAVLEHVLEPWQVSDEITRLLKEGGFIYSELPFLQGVHEGAYDFTRFT